MIQVRAKVIHLGNKFKIQIEPIQLKTLNIYKEPLENLKTPVITSTQENVMEISATDMHNVSITMLHTEQKEDITCRKLASQIHDGKKVVSSQLLCLQMVFYKNNTFMV